MPYETNEEIEAMAVKVASAIANPVAQRLGWTMTNPENARRSGSRVFFGTKVQQDLGIFAAIIRKAEIRVFFEHSPAKEATETAEAEDGYYWINVGLSYQHPGGGTNGKDAMTIWLNEDFQMTGYRLEGQEPVEL